MNWRIKKLLEENSLKMKILTVFTITIVTLTSLMAILYLFTPILIGYQKTSNGIIEYFEDPIDPSFVIKVYSNNQPVNAIISVYINQPRRVVFYKEFYGQSVKIPFTAIVNYVEPWGKYENVNTSLLVIATYVNGNETYSSAEEIEYNPSWVLEDKPIEIVADINIIPKLIKLNMTTIQQEINKIQTLRKEILTNNQEEKHPYILNVSEEEYEGKPVLKGSWKFKPVTSIVYFYNFSVPLNWVTLSNNVNEYDNYSMITLYTGLFYEVSWLAVSNSTNYGGPYIGVSYSAKVNWNTMVIYGEYLLSKLYDPTIYTYYNATIAVVIYRVYEDNPSYAKFGNPYVPYVTVFEILWASPNLGAAVESGNGITCVIYTNSSGEYRYPLAVGNGSVTLLYTYFSKLFIGKLESGPYGFARWENGKVSTSGNVEPDEPGGGGFWFNAQYIDQYAKDNRTTETVFDAAALVLSLLAPELEIPEDVVAAIDIGHSIVSFLFSSSTQIEYYFINTFVTVDLPATTTGRALGSGQVYVSYLNYSSSLETPLLGFIMNYSYYYDGG
ncbi:hypothetical protein [Stygiolobus azoricus]|uniref:Uncharacterized protein n=1 Tax=Stygiolobus azoricus TaxID=41675 RepID=A0A650CP67_9CREN|nr:hypothetical protein [Stygiolobus azoricus]QGR19634.1 hypothetical protein D1868_06245 [Stygiolobus azoricus]